MSAKNRDKNGRWRALTIGFRVSEEENEYINEAVALSGLTKQDYIIKKLLNRDVVVVGNPRVFKALKTKMTDIYSELLRLNSAGEINASLLDTIRYIADIYNGLLQEKTERNE